MNYSRKYDSHAFRLTDQIPGTLSCHKGQASFHILISILLILAYLANSRIADLKSKYGFAPSYCYA